jgi:cell division protein ZapD
VLILYEYPLNERMRTFLRLEDLFERMWHFVRAPEAYDHHAALLTIFEIIEVCGRGDIKTDLLQELERQRQTLTGFRGNPGVQLSLLDDVLNEVERALPALVAQPGKTGQHIRDNEWLSTIRSRAIIPGGTCEFDLPSYHAWLCRPLAQRQENLDEWVTPFKPLEDALRITMRLLRKSGNTREATASAGIFQQDMKGKVFQLVRLWVDLDLKTVPEISANKYVLHIRFTHAGIHSRPASIDQDVPFRLAMCNF